jgi:hypothetical protein
MKKHKVYFARVNVNTPTSLIASLPLEPLAKEVKDLIGGTKCEYAARCYSVKDEIRNSFVYKAPADMSIMYDEQGFFGLEPESIARQGDYFVQITDVPTDDPIPATALLQLYTSFGLFFFSETPLEMTIQTPNFHMTKVKHIPLVVGGFNIAKWFRPIFPSYANYTYEDFHIKRGDALMYIKFHTDKAVELEEFEMNATLERYSRAALDYKFIKQWVPLKRLYEMFLANKMNKKIAAEIKRQRG